jgi:hypothetical protein
LSLEVVAAVQIMVVVQEQADTDFQMELLQVVIQRDLVH